VATTAAWPLLEVALEGDYWRPTYVNCGTKLVERTAKGGANRFWGCAGFPKCRTTTAMRAGWVGWSFGALGALQAEQSHSRSAF